MIHEDLNDVAERYGYILCADGLWREFCVQCNGTAGKTDCTICHGHGFLMEDGNTDDQMWQYVWDRRDSEAEDMARP